MNILLEYKRNNKVVCYRVGDAINGVYIISQVSLYEKMIKNKVKVENAYIRGNSIVVKAKVPVIQLKCNTPIPIKFIKKDNKPFKIDSIFGAMVTPSMLDKTAISIIKRIDNAKPLKDVYTYGRFETQYGICDMDSLSSGCKSVVWGYINQRDNQKTCIDMSSSGLNAQLVLFDVLSKYSTINICVGYRCLSELYSDDFEKFYLFRDVTDGRIKSFIDFFCDYINEV